MLYVSSVAKALNEREAPTIALVPEGWQRTSRKAEHMAGLEWRSYRRGINRYVLIAEAKGHFAVIYSNPGSTWGATLDKQPLGRRYRSEMSAAVAIAKALAPPAHAEAQVSGGVAQG